MADSYTDPLDDVLTESEWLILDAHRTEYENAVERFVSEVDSLADSAWPAVDEALVRLNDAYTYFGAVMEERRKRLQAVGVELSNLLVVRR